MGSRLAEHLLFLQGVLALLGGGGAWRVASWDHDLQCHRAEHPVITHAEIEPWLHKFRDEKTVDYSRLTFDPGLNELIVGARNHLFRLRLEDLSLIQLTDLTEIHDQISGMARCPYSPQHNSTALITSNGELYAATAMDFPGRDPAIYRSLGGLPPLRTAQYNSKWLNDLTEIHDQISGMARCPYSPQHNSTALITSNGELYAATAMDFPGRDPAIYRSLGGLPPLRTAQYNSKWLNEPNIVSSYDIGNFIYFFFRENAVEHDCGKVVFSRAARVCRAVRCTAVTDSDLSCGTIDYGVYMNLTERNLQDAQKFILMHEVVQPVTPIPYFMEDNSRFSHIVVDVVQGKDMLFHIIYLATDYGTIKKVLSPLNNSMSSCLLDEIELFPSGQRQPIRSLQILHSQSILFVGLWDHVIKIPLMHCTFYKTRSACVGARDPYCGWDLVLKKCTTLDESLSMSQWEQSITECPEYQSCNTVSCPEMKKSTPWTPWTPVNISDNGGHYEQRFRYTCKARLADPTLLEAGRQRIEMRYCSSDGTTGCSTDGELLRSGRFSAHTVNGGWSSWTSWSQCSRDCNKGIRSRKRTCNNPEPKYGGMPCLGPSQEYQECNITPCPVDGSWSCWSSWSKCSVTCGGGHCLRTRTCTNPPPAYEGDICLGLHTEEALCNTLPCPESWSGWSEWSECDSSGLQVRVRHCDILFPTGNQCYGNRTETKTCIFESNFISDFVLKLAHGK
ncbi:UNVERIFIED_CONTAM: hypothetical protein FKN15_035391 [Acipenser sinensis]